MMHQKSLPKGSFLKSTKNPKAAYDNLCGNELSLGPDFGTITVVKTFRNFNITVDGDKRIVIDDPQPGSNPAVIGSYLWN